MFCWLDFDLLVFMLIVSDLLFVLFAWVHWLFRLCVSCCFVCGILFACLCLF